ncbi:hypothetical protein GCM10009000_075830 [Halobacterium noricense]
MFRPQSRHSSTEPTENDWVEETTEEQAGKHVRLRSDAITVYGEDEATNEVAQRVSENDTRTCVVLAVSAIGATGLCDEITGSEQHHSWKKV